jgi:hypothetical protein
MSVARSTSRTARTAIRCAAMVALAAVTLGSATGCGSLAQAQQAVSRADLVNDLATRLTAGGDQTYAADYQLPGGRSASIVRAQKPPRTAFTYPAGKLIVTRDAVTECRTDDEPARCTRTAPPSPGLTPAALLFTDAGELGVVPPATVAGLLSAAALDSDAEIRQTDTIVAGEHATCVRVEGVDNAPASTFDTCVTTVGALGSFTGVVNGSTVDMTLTGYRDQLPTGAFAVPDRATVVDERPGAK